MQIMTVWLQIHTLPVALDVVMKKVKRSISQYPRKANRDEINSMASGLIRLEDMHIFKCCISFSQFDVYRTMWRLCVSQKILCTLVLLLTLRLMSPSLLSSIIPHLLQAVISSHPLARILIIKQPSCRTCCSTVTSIYQHHQWANWWSRAVTCKFPHNWHPISFLGHLSAH